MTNLVEERPHIYAPEEASSLLARLREILTERSIDCYVVGGFIRDGLLGRLNSDIDVVVSGDASSIAPYVSGVLQAKLVPLDDINQVFRVVVRLDTGIWYLDFASMRGSIEEDLRNRDFTINAIAIKLENLEGEKLQEHIIDPYYGQRDLNDGIIRAIGDSCFRDDPARLLRAIRFAATHGCSLEPATESLIRRDCRLITTVAAERLLIELSHILESPRTYQSLRSMDLMGLLDPLMPELSSTKNVAQPKEHFWNVFDHSIETVAEVERLLRQREDSDQDDLLTSVPWTPELVQHFTQEIAGGRTRGAVLKLAALFHDLGKPITKTMEQDGRMRFLGHPHQGAAMATERMGQLRLSNREIKMVQLMTEHHMRPGYLVGEDMPTQRAIYRYFRDTADVGIDTLFLGLADHLAARGPTLDADEWRKHTETMGYMLSKHFEEVSTLVPPKLIDGHILIDKLGLTPGPQMGELLEAVREAQAAGEIDTAEEALDFVKTQLGINK
jgi:poly(A) polymerase